MKIVIFFMGLIVSHLALADSADRAVIAQEVANCDAGLITGTKCNRGRELLELHGRIDAALNGAEECNPPQWLSQDANGHAMIALDEVYRMTIYNSSIRVYMNAGTSYWNAPQDSGMTVQDNFAALTDYITCGGQQPGIIN